VETASRTDSSRGGRAFGRLLCERIAVVAEELRYLDEQLDLVSGEVVFFDDLP
jgi:hypothetical protein